MVSFIRSFVRAAPAPGSEISEPLSRGDKESTRDYRIKGVPLMVLFMLFFLPGHRTFEANCQASLKTSAICPQDVLVNINFLASAL